MTTADKAARRDAVTAALLRRIDSLEPLTIVQAPPGSGKTYTILQGLALAWHRGRRVAVATQTNSQAEDLSRSFARAFPRIPLLRLASQDLEVPDDLPANLSWIQRSKELPAGRPAIVVGTADKWASSKVERAFDWLFVDEAWQLPWAKLRLLGKVSGRFVLVGDPGQIAPVVSIPTQRWDTADRPPHRAAPAVLLDDPQHQREVLRLPITTRLPHDTAALVRGFYGFDFESWSGPGERQLVLEAGAGDPADGLCEALTRGSLAALTLPTPAQARISEDDPELAAALAQVARRLLERRAQVQSEADPRPRRLRPQDIGVAATHRVLVTRIREALGELAEAIVVDTAERWQGLEREVLLCAHPLSAAPRPTAFDLDTGRLNVMLSRHRTACVIATRDHLGATLSGLAPRAEQALGQEDAVGWGQRRHLELWQSLEAAGRVHRLGG